MLLPRLFVLWLGSVVLLAHRYLTTAAAAPPPIPSGRPCVDGEKPSETHTIDMNAKTDVNIQGKAALHNSRSRVPYTCDVQKMLVSRLFLWCVHLLGSCAGLPHNFVMPDLSKKYKDGDPLTAALKQQAEGGTPLCDCMTYPIL